MIKNTIEAPLWPSVDTIPAQYPWLSADETCEVAVLGGGVTAAMCALRFAEAGIDTVLVSASPVGFGGSACSSGMMTLASGDSLVSLVEEIGAERAMSAAELLLGSLKNLEDFCASTEDGCGFHRKDSLLYTSEEACTSKLRREYSLRLHNGLDVELLNADTASEQFTFPMEAGVYTKNAAAQVDPYRLTHAAVRAAKEKGARIYENPTASAINQSAQDDITLECSTHHRIQARYVIVAAGLETHRYCGGLTQAGTTYLLATEPVEEFAGWRGTCLIHREGDARQYITVLLCFMPMSMLQCLFLSFLVTAGRPGLGLGLTVGAGFANMVLDYVFIVPLGMGIAGAALATAIGYCIPALGGLRFFSRNRSGLRFIRPRWDFTVLLKSCANGASEMVTNLASSIITVIFNLILMAWIGTDGVAAITVIMYAQFLMVAFFMGFSIGVAPVFGFHYGAGNHQYLLHIRDHCIRFVLGASVVVCAVSFLSSGLIAVIFTPEGSLSAQLVNRGMRLFSLSFLFAGYNIFASALFTALSDGRTSALISFARTFFFILAGIWLMTTLLGLDGLWLAIPFAELVTAGLSFYMIRTRFLADAQKMDE